MILLKAKNENWGLTRAGDWKRTEYVLSHSGRLRIKVFFLHPVVDTSIEVAIDDMSVIKNNLEEIISNPSNKIPEACDGEAWSFTAYDVNGKQIFKWKLSHIYGLVPLETIGRILDSYVPEYEKPNYSEEEIEKYIMHMAR